MGENRRQFDSSLGRDYAQLGEQGRQFDRSLGRRETEWDDRLGFDWAEMLARMNRDAYLAGLSG